MVALTSFTVQWNLSKTTAQGTFKNVVSVTRRSPCPGSFDWKLGLQRVGVWPGNEFGYFYPGSMGTLSGIFDIVCTVSVHLHYIDSVQ